MPLRFFRCESPVRGSCGCSSVVERNLAKVDVVGSSPIIRSLEAVRVCRTDGMCCRLCGIASWSRSAKIYGERNVLVIFRGAMVV